MKFEAVYIEWDDAIVYSPRWKDVDDLKNDAKMIEYCHEVGFIIEENDKYILLAARYLIVSADGEPDVGSPISIPRSQMRKRKTLKL